jgi:hypothetical protein
VSSSLVLLLSQKFEPQTNEKLEDYVLVETGDGQMFRMSPAQYERLRILRNAIVTIFNGQTQAQHEHDINLIIGFLMCYEEKVRCLL